jgi:hypothetical protein
MVTIRRKKNRKGSAWLFLRESGRILLRRQHFSRALKGK